MTALRLDPGHARGGKMHPEADVTSPVRLLFGRPYPTRGPGKQTQISSKAPIPRHLLMTQLAILKRPCFGLSSEKMGRAMVQLESTLEGVEAAEGLELVAKNCGGPIKHVT
jgi:hypothetical protein